jgi:anti-anti-sigma factor
MKIETRTIGDVTVLRPKGMFVGGDETDELAAQLDVLLKSGVRKLVLNCGGIAHVSSIPLGVLAVAAVRYRKAGADIKVCAVDQRLDALLAITKLCLIFEPYDKEEEAVESFRGTQAVPSAPDA